MYEEIINTIGDAIFQFASGTQSNPVTGVIVLFIGLVLMVGIAQISKKG